MPLIDPVKYPLSYFTTDKQLKNHSDGWKGEIIEKNEKPLIYNMEDSRFQGIPHYTWMDIKSRDNLKRAIHITIQDSDDTLINYDYGPGNKLFWFKNEDNKWPDCVNEALK